MAKKVAVKPPEYTLKILTDFSLKNLEKTFSIADFERPLRPRHVQKIVVAIQNNEFFDNIIGVFLKRNGQYEIIDGQHRIEALGILRDAHDLTRYNLVLRIFPERLARKIYRRINLGQALKMQEHLRALDNEKHPFFVRSPEVHPTPCELYETDRGSPNRFPSHFLPCMTTVLRGH